MNLRTRSARLIRTAAWRKSSNAANNTNTGIDSSEHSAQNITNIEAELAEAQV